METSRTVLIRVSREVRTTLRLLAKVERRTMAEVLRRALEVYRPERGDGLSVR